MAVRLARLGWQIVMEDGGGGERLVSPDTIIRQAAQRCGVSYEEVMSRSRLAEIVDARHEAINALATLGYKPSQIAREMKLHGTTVSFHLGRISGKVYRSCLA